MSKHKLNTHQLLDDYRHLANYPTIAQETAAWVKTNPGVTKLDVQRWVQQRYGAVSFAKMKKSAAPLEIFGTIGEHIPASAVDQMYTVMRLPMATKGALMPDAHLGYAMPIGGVAVLEGAVSPSFVGYDISCMVQLSILDLDVNTFEQGRPHFAETLQSVTSFGMGADFARGAREHAVMEDSAWQALQIPAKLKAVAQQQLGSSGGGNHFADLVVIELLDNLESWCAGAQLVGLLTHSGSRGAGHKLATHYVKQAAAHTNLIAKGVPNGYEWLPLDHDLGREYLAAMTLMGDYAHANHDLIHDHFCRVAGLQTVQRIWNRHNYAWVEGNDVIHRKGATPANRGELGLIPGTSGTASYVVRGLGNAESLNSSSHGAGRWHSRSQAKREHDESRFQKHMTTNDIMHFGLAPDETFLAYKDIEMVMGLQAGVLVEPIARMTPRVVIMGGQSDDGD
ncbi:MAG: RtcB family protein [Caldilineaceae bacterium]|nr:RtcB family protein [Caldilineaceae bacterium]